MHNILMTNFDRKIIYQKSDIEIDKRNAYFY